MSDRPDNKTAASEASWDIYWEGQPVAGDPPYLKVLAQFWRQTFERELLSRDQTALLDMACGDGAVTRHALKVSEGRDIALSVTSLDSSPAAISALSAEHPGVKGIVANASATTLPTAGFDIVTSQFGLEYAGIEAFAEAARLTAAKLICVMHRAGGALHEECAVHLQACRQFASCGFLERADKAFNTGFGALAGSRSVAAFKREQDRFAPAVVAAGDILKHYGNGVAGGLIARTVTGVEQLYRRMRHHEPANVQAWLARVQLELHAYTDRMQAMTDAAVDETRLAQIVATLREAGLDVETNNAIAVDDAEPFSLVLIARRN